MSKPSVGSKNVPLVIWLFSLILLLTAGPAAALSQYTDLTCASCHGMPPVDAAIRDWTTGRFQGNHATHLPTAATITPTACVKCHNNSGYTLEHYDARIQMASRLNGYSTSRYNKPVFFNQTSRPLLTTCSNTNCHFETLTPTWGSAPLGNGPSDCETCHTTAPPNTGMSTQSKSGHSVHTSYPQMAWATTCDVCHVNHLFEPSPYQHATSAGKRGIYIGTALRYTGPTNDYLPSQTHVFGKCSNSYCHSNGNPTPNAVPAKNVAFKMMTTPDFGTTGNGCGICHAAQPVTNAHTRHTASAGLGCALCHAATVSDNVTISNKANHVNNVKDVAFAGSAAGTTWSGGTCSTSYCHSNGATPPVYQSVSWASGTTLSCASCHPTLSGAHTAHVGTLLSSVTFYAYTTNKSTGSELTANTYYAFGCANCHPTDLAKHANGAVDIDLSQAAAGGSLKAKNSLTAAYTKGAGTCAGVYCHSNGQATVTYATAPNWFGGAIAGDKCAACHGNSPTSGAHTAHAVGIHYDDVFNGVFGKYSAAAGVGKPAGHGDPAQSTTLSCNICHNTTINVGYNDQNNACASCHTGAKAKGNAKITDRSKHVNGSRDLSFWIGGNVKSKAQLRDSVFADYTAGGGFWNRNGGYKAGSASYDSAKNPLSNSMYSAGTCSNIACHNGRPVNWTTDVGKGAECVLCHSKL